MLSFQTVVEKKSGPGAELQVGRSGTEAVVRARGVPAGESASMAGMALAVMDLRKSYRSGFLKRRLRGIEGVSFTVPRGTAFALLGHNGAGKTTTINCILDLVHPDGGEVRIMGRDHRHRQARAHVGYLPERPYFFEHLTGRELLLFYADLLGLPVKVRRQRLDEVLARTGMTSHANRRLRKFSKGMLQRIGLAQTLLGDPDILILDEPMSGLDPMGRREVRELILELKGQGKTIILSSHIVPDVEMIADSVGIMREGNLIATHNLQDFGSACRYEVSLAPRQGERDVSLLPDWARAQTAGRLGERPAVTAGDVGQLRELLTVCHENRIPVQSVDTRRTGLEEVFLTAHTGATAEVVK